MAVRIGKIALVGLSNIYTEDTRSLVQQRGPGMSGSVTQDLGREPVTIVMEGVLVGDDTTAALEELRQAQTKAKPLSFAADAIAGASLTDVLIVDFQVKQLAGYQGRYSFFLRVREYTEPPPPRGTAAVDAGVKKDAQAWAKGSTAAAAVIQNPSSLMSAVDKNPDLLGHLGASELGNIVNSTKDNLSGRNFGTLMKALGKVNPAIIGDFIKVVGGSGNLGDFIQKLANEGVNLIHELTGVDLGAALDVIKVIKDISGASDFLAKLQKVVGSATQLVETIGAFEPLAGFEALPKDGFKPSNEQGGGP
ncbi:hypothetical protein [Archangium violaceum]|uniref:hypothetical protein n=1 Tax=Archangium violaceum TaxID=83451 RepID=UPI0036D9741E